MVGRMEEGDASSSVVTEDNPNTQKFGSGKNTGIPPAVEKEEPHAPLPEAESLMLPNAICGPAFQGGF